MRDVPGERPPVVRERKAVRRADALRANEVERHVLQPLRRRVERPHRHAARRLLRGLGRNVHHDARTRQEDEPRRRVDRAAAPRRVHREADLRRGLADGVRDDEGRGRDNARPRKRNDARAVAPEDEVLRRRKRAAGDGEHAPRVVVLLEDVAVRMPAEEVVRRRAAEVDVVPRRERARRQRVAPVAAERADHHLAARVHVLQRGIVHDRDAPAVVEDVAVRVRPLRDEEVASLLRERARHAQLAVDERRAARARKRGGIAHRDAAEAISNRLPAVGRQGGALRDLHAARREERRGGPLVAPRRADVEEVPRPRLDVAAPDEVFADARPPPDVVQAPEPGDDALPGRVEENGRAPAVAAEGEFPQIRQVRPRPVPEDDVHRLARAGRREGVVDDGLGGLALHLERRVVRERQRARPEREVRVQVVFRTVRPGGFVHAARDEGRGAAHRDLAAVEGHRRPAGDAALGVALVPQAEDGIDDVEPPARADA